MSNVHVCQCHITYRVSCFFAFCSYSFFCSPLPLVLCIKTVCRDVWTYTSHIHQHSSLQHTPTNMRLIASLFLTLAALSAPCTAVSTLARLSARLAAAESTLAQLTAETSTASTYDSFVRGYRFDGASYLDVNQANESECKNKHNIAASICAQHTHSHTMHMSAMQCQHEDPSSTVLLY